MSVTLAPIRRKSRTTDATHITLGAVPLFHTVTDSNTDTNIQFGVPHRNQIGSRKSDPIDLLWDAGATFIKVGILNEVKVTATHVEVEGYIEPGSFSQVALGSLRSNTPVWACPKLTWEPSDITKVYGAASIISGWRFDRQIMLTTNERHQAWPYRLTPIMMQVGAGGAPLTQ